MYREATLTLTSSLIAATVVVFVAVCVVTDLRTRRIPNAISGPAMLIGIALNTAHMGTAGLLDSLRGRGRQDDGRHRGPAGSPAFPYGFGGGCDIGRGRNDLAPRAPGAPSREGDGDRHHVPGGRPDPLAGPPAGLGRRPRCRRAPLQRPPGSGDARRAHRRGAPGALMFGRLGFRRAVTFCNGGRSIGPKMEGWWENEAW